MRRLALCALAAVLLVHAPARSAAAQTDGIVLLLERMTAALETGDRDAYRRLFIPQAANTLVISPPEDFVAPGATRVVVRERDRAPLPGVPDGEGYRLLVEVFTEFGLRGQITTLRMDARRLQAAPGNEGDEDTAWIFASQERLAAVEGLHRLSLDVSRQFAVRNLTFSAEDLTLLMPSGSVFVAQIDDGFTALVLLGDGTMRFAPKAEAERGQVRIFAGQEVLEAGFTAAFVRLNPEDASSLISEGSLSPRPLSARDAGRAQEVFDTEVVKSFNLDLNDLSRQTWSLVPALGDVLVEVRTKKYRTLTYIRSSNEAEDISLFDRARRRNISVYPSERKLASRGRFYDEDELADYDVVDYHVNAAFAPEREWLEGRVRLRLRVRAYQITALTFRLHEALIVRSVVSDQHGRLLTLRVKGQNNVLVSLPQPLPRDSVLTLAFVYGGRLPPQQPDREALVPGDGQVYQNPGATAEAPTITPEPRFVYSNRSWWYPQSAVTDYTTATLRLTVPPPYSVVASGDPSIGNPPPGTAADHASSPRTFEFVAGQPVRYLSWLITRHAPVGATTVHLRPPAEGVAARPEPAQGLGGIFYDALELGVVANPRQVSRSRGMVGASARIMDFYAQVLGDVPYPTFTLALVDSDLPGGHSPAYFAVLYQPLPLTPFFWRGDPVNFDSFPEFFLAHELAHQYWGQAVGWKSYHEQWISEAFAQYFAALYAERFEGKDVFRDLLRQMRRSAIDYSGQGPIHLGYRLGHIQGDSRIFRAVIYNKGAMVLHMLRRLVGDDVFFRALRAFYYSARFRKVGTDDLKAVFERESGRALDRFFEQWVLGSDIPTVGFRYDAGPATGPGTTETATVAAGAPEARLVFEQRSRPFDLPVTVTITYASGEIQELVVRVSEAVVEQRVPLRGPVRSIEANDDHAALARVERRSP